MTNKKKCKQTINLNNTPSIVTSYSIVGKKEKNGPLGNYFDYSINDSYLGQKSWEKAESALIERTINGVLSKAGLEPDDISYLFAGDLINQCTSSSYGIRNFNIPYFGLYGACSTMAESLSLASMFVDAGYCNYALACTSSHFCSAEKQFRLPLEYGGQRPPTSQWTVTGAGAIVLGNQGKGPYITDVTIGKIVDYGIKDANNMGAAMAPAAVDTIYNHFVDTDRGPDYYDLIITGDLGKIGKEIFLEMIKEKGFDIEDKFTDCGIEIFNSDDQDVHAGGSGCGCSAVVLSGYILNRMNEGIYNRVLFIATGALMSPLIIQQGETIPSIAHAVSINNKME